MVAEPDGVGVKRSLANPIFEIGSNNVGYILFV